jgi:hypothetical protein
MEKGVLQIVHGRLISTGAIAKLTLDAAPSSSRNTSRWALEISTPMVCFVIFALDQCSLTNAEQGLAPMLVVRALSHAYPFRPCGEDGISLSWFEGKPFSGNGSNFLTIHYEQASCVSVAPTCPP